MQTEEEVTLYCECQKCHHEFPQAESMPDPETDSGDFCPECYFKLDDAMKLKKAAAPILEMLGPIEDFGGFRKTRSLKEFLHGNCHHCSRWVANVINLHERKDIGARVVRGFWSQRGGAPHQHSWVRVKVADAPEFILDPTQCQFTGEEPSWAICDEDNRYDECGWWLEHYTHDSRQPYNRFVDVPFTGPARKQVEKLLEKKLGAKMDVADLVWILHRHPCYLTEKHGRTILTQAYKAGHGALMPMETQIYFGLHRDPDADVNRRNHLFSMR